MSVSSISTPSTSTPLTSTLAQLSGTNTDTSQTPTSDTASDPTSSTTSYLAQDAVTLSTNVGIADTLSGAISPLTYDAQTLLNTFLQSSQTSQSAASTSSATSSTGLNSSWAQILQQNPALSGTVTSDILNQNLINTLA